MDEQALEKAISVYLDQTRARVYEVENVIPLVITAYLENVQTDYDDLIRHIEAKQFGTVGLRWITAIRDLTAKVEDPDAWLKNQNVMLRSENAKLRDALEALTAACEKDLGGPRTAAFDDNESVSFGPHGDSAMTFGHIRRARAALKGESDG